MIDKVGEEFDHPSALQNEIYRIFACWSTFVVIRWIVQALSEFDLAELVWDRQSLVVLQ